MNQHYTDRSPGSDPIRAGVGTPAAAPPLWPVTALVLVSFLFATGHVLARFAFAHQVTVSTAAFARVGAAALLLFALIMVRREPIRMEPRRFLLVVPIGFFIAIQTFAIQTSVSMMPVGIAIPVFYTFPFFTGLASRWLGEVRFDARLGGTLVLALTGLGMVVGIGDRPANWQGIGLALVAAVCFMSALLLTPRLGAGMSVTVRTFITMLSASTVLAALAIGRGALLWPPTAAGQFALIGLALCYACGISTLFLLLPRLGAVQTAVLLNLEPVAVTVIAWLALGESLAVIQVIGALVVVGAVILYQAGGASARRARE